VQQLRRSLGLLDATMVNVGVMIGSTIFMTAGEVARLLPHPLWQLTAWVVAALFSLAGALTMAELGTRMPQAGGLYVYLSEAFGPAWGFFYGWALFVVIQTAAIAAVAVAFASYVGHFVTMSGIAPQLLAAVTIGAITALNVLGVREGVLTQNVFTSVKLVLTVGLIVLAFTFSSGTTANLVSAPAGSAGWHIGAFGAALICPLFAFDGWITTSYIGGELRSPTRTLPWAAALSVAIVAVVYLGLNGAYLHVLGPSLASSRLVAADTARAVLGTRGANIAAALVVISAVGALNGMVLSGARISYAMADAGLFWRPAARIHPRFGTPAMALYAQGAVAIALVFAGGFEQLLTSCLFASWLFYALGGVAVFVLRRRMDLPRGYQVWGYPLVPAVFVLFAALLLISTVVAAPREAALGGGLLATGLPAYWLFRRAGTAAPAATAAREPS
jgi:APA family basic amino acid/polyamine antiporter